VVSKGIFDGREIIGIRLNWDKRYITLAPIATVLGLAFKLYDPDHLMGEEDEYGITAALIPTDTPGVETGKRHLPLDVPFQNGPTRGKDVFVPLDFIIGGPERAGQGCQRAGELLCHRMPWGDQRRPFTPPALTPEFANSSTFRSGNSKVSAKL
jgi:acyl-CoA dehydrogenase